MRYGRLTYCFLFLLFGVTYSTAQTDSTVIENFENNVILFSYNNEDNEPFSWEIDTSFSYTGNASLKIYGNSWKSEQISPKHIDTSTVWSVAVYSMNLGEIQGFGVSDGTNSLFYSFYGTEEVEFPHWQTAYQGAFPQNQWKRFLLPIGRDWLAEFGYLPNINFIVFINDKDETTSGTVFFDEITDITTSLPQQPVVSISYTTGNIQYGNSQKSVHVNFFSNVYDPDSEEFSYYWDFGDGNSSNVKNPEHTFNITDDHEFTVTLEVTDESNNYAFTSCKVTIDEGESSLPLTLNFVGDIMLARGMETIIDNDGIESIFEPTYSCFGGNADISVANLECTLTDANTHHPTKPIYFKGKPEYVSGLAYAGIVFVNLANNHIYDYLDEGLVQTIDVLNENGIANSGAGINEYFASKPAFISRKGIAVAFVGASDRTGQYNNYQPYLNAGFDKAGFENLTEYNISEQINEARNVADLVIYQMHAGHEYSTAPSKIENSNSDEFYDENYLAPTVSDIEIRRFAIDCGADAVICHHPHITQGFEVYKGKLIAHSLGNFVFDMGYPETFPSVILKGFSDGSKFNKYEIIPIYINDYVPQRAEGELGLYWLNSLADKSRKLNAYVSVNNDSVKAEIITDTSRIEFHNTDKEIPIVFFLNEGSYYSKPVKLEKNGSISQIFDLGGITDFQYRLGRELVWFGNMEDEGADAWQFNHPDEFFDYDNYYEGERSICQRRPSGRLPLNTYLRYRLKIYHPERKFTLHSFIKTQNAKNSGVQILIYDSRNSDYNLGVFQLDNEISGTNDWAEFFGDFEIPENGRYYNIRLRSESPSNGTGKSWFDNTGVIEWEDWQTFNESTEIAFPNDYYWIQIRTDEQLTSSILNYVETKLTESPSAIEETDEKGKPLLPVLYQNYPNPFNPITTIEYLIPKVKTQNFELGQYVKLKIYDVLGRELMTLVNQNQKPGNYKIHFNASQLPSGVYFYRLTIGKISITKKMVLLK